MRMANKNSSRAQRYMAKGLECELAAKSAADRNVRAIYLDLARQWRQLAFQAEMLDREHPKPLLLRD